MIHSLQVKRKEGIIAAYLAGDPIKEIAKRFGVSEAYPAGIARKAGFPSRTRETRKP